MVAKSYQELEIVGEVFTASNRQYVNVKTKTGKLKTVRWYSDKEYAKMYPEEVAVARSTDPQTKTAKEVLGFTKGYITIFKGDQEANREWFERSICRYAVWWGWYVISTDEVPEDLPLGIEPVRLDWEIVGDGNGKRYSEDKVKTAVDNLLFNDSATEHVGTIGERLELDVIVVKQRTFDGAYGISTDHLFIDGHGHLFSWLTSAKQWSVGTQHNIRGTVKEHKVVKGERITVLTRCVEVSK